MDWLSLDLSSLNLHSTEYAYGAIGIVQNKPVLPAKSQTAW